MSAATIYLIRHFQNSLELFSVSPSNQIEFVTPIVFRAVRLGIAKLRDTTVNFTQG